MGDPRPRRLEGGRRRARAAATPGTRPAAGSPRGTRHSSTPRSSRTAVRGPGANRACSRHSGTATRASRRGPPSAVPGMTSAGTAIVVSSCIGCTPRRKGCANCPLVKGLHRHGCTRFSNFYSYRDITGLSEKVPGADPVPWSRPIGMEGLSMAPRQYPPPSTATSWRWSMPGARRIPWPRSLNRTPTRIVTGRASRP